MKNTKITIRTIVVAIVFTTFFSNFTTYAFTKANTTTKPKITIKKATVAKVSSSTKKSRKSLSSRGISDSIYGQALDWWTSASKIFSRGQTAVVTDLYTGKSFNVMRTMGTNHADSEALTKHDTDIIKDIWGGFSWDRRPVIVTVNGVRIAASMSGMPHAGLDSKPAYEVINNRSAGYGTGENLDVIKNNGMDGHFDIHFLNSTRHKDGEEDPQHQQNVLIAAGKK